jgi:hypothetical protein
LVRVPDANLVIVGGMKDDYVQQEFTPEAAHRKLGTFYSMMESKASEAGA